MICENKHEHKVNAPATGDAVTKETINGDNRNETKQVVCNIDNNQRTSSNVDTLDLECY